MSKETTERTKQGRRESRTEEQGTKSSRRN